MPTIRQLPQATTYDPSDVLPVAQGATTRGLSLATLLAGVQQNIIAIPGRLLGRYSSTSGAPQGILIGSGLSFSSDGMTLNAAGGSGGPRPYDIPMFRYRLPLLPEPIISLIMVRQIVLPAGLTASTASLKNLPTGTVSLPITKNSMQVGSIQFAAGAGAGTFVFNSQVTYSIGDELELLPPTVADPTAGYLRATLVGSA